MLARHLRIEIAVALSLFGGASWLAGVSVPFDVMLAAVAGLLAFTAILVIASFAMAHTAGGLLGAPGVRLAEWSATVLTYLVLQPFAAGWLRRDMQIANASPVLLVHGYLCNRAAFWRLSRVLAREGFSVHTHDLEPVYAGVDEHVAALAARIDEILARSGSMKLAVVCHSMGGLALRAYLNAHAASLNPHGTSKVSVLVTLGTPHHGTRLARWGLGTNARQMEPDSAWLLALAAGETNPPHVPVVSIYSVDDNIVAPQESSRLAGAENLSMSGLGHLSLLYSDAVAAHVVRALRAVRGT